MGSTSFGDAGASIGSALALWHHEFKKRIIFKNDAMKGSLLGPKYEMMKLNLSLRGRCKIYKIFYKWNFRKNSKFFNPKKVIGWYQGKMNLGQELLVHALLLQTLEITKCKKLLI